MAKNNLEAGVKVVKKKPFYLRWWFILLAIIAVLVVAISISNLGEKIEWENMVLGEMLPEPPNDRGEIFNNDSAELNIDVEDVTAKEHAEYIQSCKNMGFVIDEETSSGDFTAYNTAGYKLQIDYLESLSEMGITLEKPMELSSIQWPTSDAGKQLPVPKSTIGKYTHEDADGFFVYIGDTSKAEYTEYVNQCIEKGFDIEYSKGDNYYYADNNQGWHIYIKYEGNQIISIDIDAPDEDEVIGETPSIETPTASDNSDPQNVETIDPEFKEAMDEYEAFISDYVAFMKKYYANPGDLSLLSDYAEFISDYNDYVDEFDDWEDENLNSKELDYYVEVQTRVTKKLLEVAQ